MKLIRLAFFYLLLGAIQLIVFSCCEDYYTEHKIIGDGAGFIFSSMAPNYQTFTGEEPIDATGNDSIQVQIGFGTEWTSVNASDFASLNTSVYATSPCEPLFYKRMDSIINFSVTITDSAGLELPNDTVLNLLPNVQREIDYVVGRYNDINNWNYDYVDLVLNLMVRPHEAYPKTRLKVTLELFDRDPIQSHSSVITWY